MVLHTARTNAPREMSSAQKLLIDGRQRRKKEADSVTIISAETVLYSINKILPRQAKSRIEPIETR